MSIDDAFSRAVRGLAAALAREDVVRALGFRAEAGYQAVIDEALDAMVPIAAEIVEEIGVAGARARLMAMFEAEPQKTAALFAAAVVRLVEVDEGLREKRERADKAEFDRQVARDRRLRDEFLTHCRSATVVDYRRWLERWVAQGGETSHAYDYDLPNDWFVLASSVDPDLPPLCGSLSVKVIVPEGLSVHILPGVSHNHVFFMGGGVAGPRGSTWVPTYRNVKAARS